MKRKIPPGTIATMLFGCLLLLGIFIGHTPLAAYENDCVRHYPPDPTKVCYRAPSKDITGDLPSITDATKGYVCDEPEVWRGANPDQVPDRVVVRLLDGSIEGVTFEEAWAMAEKGQSWTLSFCSKEAPDA